MLVKTSLIIIPVTRGILDTGVIENLSKRVQRSHILSNLAPITCAASQAHHGLLQPVLLMKLWLWDVDLTSVPAAHLASLVSRVMGQAYIKNVSGCNLAIILDSVRSKVLSICKISLGSEDTQALVRAMESHVVEVVLYQEVTLDIRVLMEYSGRCICRNVECYGDTAPRYREQLSTWVRSRSWAVTFDDNTYFVINRI